MNVFLTGKNGAGKSTTIKNIVRELGIRPGGFITLRDDLLSDMHRVRMFNAQGETTDGNNVIGCCPQGQSSMQALPAIFDRLGVDLLSAPASLIIMDELGFLESEAYAFQQKVLTLLDMNTPVLGAIKTISTEFLDAVRNHPRVTVITISEHTREQAYKAALDALRRSLHIF